MRRAGARTADGWWLLLITVLGWLLVSYGSHRILGGERLSCWLPVHAVLSTSPVAE